MVKAMPDPYIPPHSSVYWYRQRAPKDVAVRAKGHSATVVVDGVSRPLKIGEELKVSLGTKDPSEAKVRARDVQDQFDRIWASFRSDEVSLTHKQAVALSGEVYRDLLVFEDDPGSPERWAHVRAVNADAINGRAYPHPLTINKNIVLDPLEERFGGFVEVVLNRHQLRVDQPSRRRVLEHVARAMDEVAALLGKRAAGDYSPDANAQRFPPLELPKPAKTRKAKALAPSEDTGTLTGLLTHKQRTQSKKEATFVVYRGYLEKFRDFIGHEIAAKITKDDVRRWRDHLMAQGLATKTINDQYLAALKSTLSHGVKEFDLPANVAAGIRDTRDAPAPSGSKGYSLEQANTILEATFRGTSKNLAIPYQRAIFWVPWICAYTGLRVSEVTQLQGRHVLEVRGIPHLLITPEDGSTKSKSAWTTGIHSHLIDLGLLEMFRAVGDGPAFYTPYPEGTDLQALKDHRAKSAGDKIAEWVRDEVGIAAPGGKPSHAWRHAFTTRSRTVKMDKETRDYMMGSRSKSDAREGYGDFEPEVTHQEINKLPRFVVSETSWRPPVTKVKAVPLKAKGAGT